MPACQQSLRFWLTVAVAYGAGVVKGSDHAKEAQAFLDDVISGPCAQIMKTAGFTPAPT